MNACTFAEVLTASGMYITASTDLNTIMNGRVQARSTDYSLESMEWVAQGVVKVLRPRRIRFDIDSKLTELSQDVRSLTHPSLVPVFSPPVKLSTVLLHKTTYLWKESVQPPILPNTRLFIPSSDKEIDATKCLCDGRRHAWETETPTGNEKPRRVHGKGANNSNLQDCYE